MSEKLLLGTYTRGASEGIYEANLNLDKERVEGVDLLALAGNPTYLTTNKSGTVIYSILSEDDQGGVVSFVFEGNQWVRRVALLTDGPAPCYLSYDEERQLIYTANYHTGTVHVYGTDETGDLNLLDTVQQEGSSIHENQEGPHAHFIAPTPDNKFVVTCNLGTDEVYTYEVTDEGKLEEKTRLQVKPGTGPRHIVFHPEVNRAYILGELSSEILVANYEPNSGEFEVVDIQPMIPATHTGFNSGAAIRITKDGKYLYASNRGHDSIVAYDIDEEGNLAFLAYYPTRGQTPRDFNLNETEEFVVVGHQDSDYLTLFKRDSEKGYLHKIQTEIEAPEVVCIHFIPVDVVEIEE